MDRGAAGTHARCAALSRRVHAPRRASAPAAFARRRVFNILFRAAASTLAAFARSRLSATIGATLVLHTWTRKLEFHPHIHAIVTGGGLAHGGGRWNAAQQAFLFPVKAMSVVFRAKMLAALRRAYRQGRFDRFADFADPEAFARLARSIAKLPWHVYAKPSFDRANYVLEYLGRYTHRVGLANSRLLEVSDSAITFRTKGSQTTTVHPVVLLRRFVDHVLPHGFHKIRHVGLYASAELHAKAQAVLGSRPSRNRRPPSWSEHLRALSGHDVSRCRRCGGAVVMRPLALARAPPVGTP